MGLSITSRDDARASTLIGRLYQTQKLDDETIFPGIPVFQKAPFESPQDGEMILCSALRLGFSSKLARGMLFIFPCLVSLGLVSYSRQAMCFELNC